MGMRSESVTMGYSAALATAADIGTDFEFAAKTMSDFSTCIVDVYIVSNVPMNGETFLILM